MVLPRFLLGRQRSRVGAAWIRYRGHRSSIAETGPETHATTAAPRAQGADSPDPVMAFRRPGAITLQRLPSKARSPHIDHGRGRNPLCILRARVLPLLIRALVPGQGITARKNGTHLGMISGYRSYITRLEAFARYTRWDSESRLPAALRPIPGPQSICSGDARLSRQLYHDP